MKYYLGSLLHRSLSILDDFIGSGAMVKQHIVVAEASCKEHHFKVKRKHREAKETHRKGGKKDMSPKGIMSVTHTHPGGATSSLSQFPSNACIMTLSRDQAIHWVCHLTS